MKVVLCKSQLCVLLVDRLLWRRDERHHPVHFLLPATEHGGELRVRHGQPVQVSLD